MIFLFYLLTSDGALSCESAGRDLCDSLSEIVPSASHITINLNDIRYQLLADAVENCTLDHAEGQPKYRFDCTKLGNQHRYLMVQESPPIFVLARQIKLFQNGLDLNEEHTTIKESFQKTTTIEVLEVTIYEGNSVKTGGSETNLRWLKNLMVGVQVVSILLLLLTALLAGISRYGEGNSKTFHYYFVLTGKKNRYSVYTLILPINVSVHLFYSFLYCRNLWGFQMPQQKVFQQQNLTRASTTCCSFPDHINHSPLMSAPILEWLSFIINISAHLNPLYLSILQN